MAHGFQIFMDVDIGPELVSLSAMRPGPAGQHLAGQVARAGGQQLHAVTGGKNHGLAHRVHTGQGPVFLVAVIDQSEAFAHIHTRRAMIETDKKDITVHGNSRSALDESVVCFHEGIHHKD